MLPGRLVPGNSPSNRATHSLKSIHKDSCSSMSYNPIIGIIDLRGCCCRHRCYETYPQDADLSMICILLNLSTL